MADKTETVTRVTITANTRGDLQRAYYDKYYNATLTGLGVMHEEDALSAILAVLESRPVLMQRVAYILSGPADDGE